MGCTPHLRTTLVARAADSAIDSKRSRSEPTTTTVVAWLRRFESSIISPRVRHDEYKRNEGDEDGDPDKHNRDEHVRVHQDRLRRRMRAQLIVHPRPHAFSTKSRGSSGRQKSRLISARVGLENSRLLMPQS